MKGVGGGGGYCSTIIIIVRTIYESLNHEHKEGHY